MIPTHFYQVCETQLNDNEIYWGTTFAQCNPGYGHTILTEKDVRAFIEAAFPWFLDRYDSLSVQDRIDVSRYFILFSEGGIFLSRDVECLSPLDQIVAVGGTVLGRMGTLDDDQSIPNSMMFSEPREEFLLLCMSLAQAGMTGHALLHRAANLYHAQYTDDSVQNRLAAVRRHLTAEQRDTRKKTNVNVLPSNQFYPINRQDPIHARYVKEIIQQNGKRIDRETVVKMFPKSFAVCYWMD